MPVTAAAHGAANRANVDDGVVGFRRPVASHRRIRGEYARGFVVGVVGRSVSNARRPSPPSSHITSGVRPPAAAHAKSRRRKCGGHAEQAARVTRRATLQRQ